MLMVAGQYHYLANRYPGAGGLYNYIKNIFGYDRAFLVAWFLFLAYISIFWANATSIPLFARYFLRNLFSVGYMYTLFGYEVYIGEALVTLAVIVIVALLSIKSKKTAANSMVWFTLLFTVGITVCFAVAMANQGGSGMSMKPAFVPGKSELGQVARIAFISPWAFIGFESISHSTEECRFRQSNMFKVLLSSLAVTTALYVFVILLSVSAYLEGCTDWLDYINRLDEFDGIEGLPAFYAAYHYMGNAGVFILMASLLALVLSSLIGIMHAVSRLCYSVAQDGILSKRFEKLNDKQIPVNAIILVVLVSVPVLFIGRTAISWIVDITTMGATIIYGFASLAVFYASKQDRSRKYRVISLICLVIMVMFLIVLMVPGIFSDHTIETETYVLIATWSVLGLLFFNSVIQKDHARNFGKAVIVWVALLVFILMMAMTLSTRINETRKNAVVDDIGGYMAHMTDNGILATEQREFLEIQRTRLIDADDLSILIVFGLFGLSLTVLLINYHSMQKWEKKMADERDKAHILAFTDPLTGVNSKYAFNVQESALDKKIADGIEAEIGVVVCDVNGLKKINDTFGHKAGDEYILSACKMLCDYYRYSQVFRVGGDEFIVLLKGEDYKLRDEVLRAINKKIEKNIKTGKVVFSLGMAIYEPKTDTSFREIFTRADTLMYERKMQLKNMGAITRE